MLASGLGATEAVGWLARGAQVSCGSVVGAFGFATAVEGANVGACVGLTGVDKDEDMVAGTESVVVVKGEKRRIVYGARRRGTYWGGACRRYLGVVISRLSEGDRCALKVVGAM